MLAKADTDARTVCFLRESNNDISCFGENSNGQLGLGADGSDADFVAPAAIRGDALNVIV
jgi:alpha-tubulin suppressor-like RCC1 family protein